MLNGEEDSATTKVPLRLATSLQDAYNAVELNRYSDYSYLQQVWTYHEQIFEAICLGDYERAKRLFIDHTNLIRSQPRMQLMHAAPESENE